ncbi:uncharacterized protein LOC116120447 [Pistacia vera]|uniref:uncharacterized protein LOC116120447 n=1 Tax=Pistacia vera TaxID=55513 RepID=UPI0012639C89|nr:uncharacterized protein LOC116120447 [Pistacia vera]
MADTGAMVFQRALKDYSSSIVEGCYSSIRRPPVQTNNFKIKPTIIQMIQNSVQFIGLPSDDPNLHIPNFFELCNTFRHNGLSNDAIRLQLFPFSVQDKAKAWLISLSSGSIMTWNELAQAFLTKYFLPAKLRSEITNFFQQDMKSLYEAWERYKDLLQSCPHPVLPIWSQVQSFYQRLLPNIQAMIDAASGGALNSKTPEKAYNLIEVMVHNSYMRTSERNSIRKAAGVHEFDGCIALVAQLSNIQKQLGNVLKINAIESSSLTCELCASNHSAKDCQEGNPFAQLEQTNYVNNFQRGKGNPYSNTYNLAWRKHSNFLWSNNNEHKQPSGFQAQVPKSNLENMLTKFIEETSKRFENNKIIAQNQSTSIRNLETKMGQINNIIVGRFQGVFPSYAKKNPKEQVHAITLRVEKPWRI